MDRLALPTLNGTASSSIVDLLNLASHLAEEDVEDDTSSDEEDHVDTIPAPLPPPSTRASTIPRLGRTISGNVVPQLPRSLDSATTNGTASTVRVGAGGEGKGEAIRVETNNLSGGGNPLNGRGRAETLSEERESLVRDELELFDGVSENVRINLGLDQGEGAVKEAELTTEELVGKLKVLQDEFGRWCDDSERFVDQIPG